MAIIKFKNGKTVHIPSQFIEPILNPEETIPEGFRKRPGKSFQLTFPHVIIKAEKEIEEYMDHIKGGGELISFTRFLLLKYYTPTPSVKFENGGVFNLPVDPKNGGRGLSYDHFDPLGEYKLRDEILNQVQDDDKR